MFPHSPKLDYVKKTTAGTSATINTVTGSFRLVAASVAFTLTNNLITSTSRVFITLASNPGGSVGTVYVVVSNGSAVITCTTAPVSNTDFNFMVVN